MKKMLDYFTIEGELGGNQDWFTNVVMKMGGCAAAAACDSCIYFSLYKGMEELYPFDAHHLTQADYKKFSQMMKPYIRPRVGGVKNPKWYIDGFRAYIADVNKKNGTRIRVPMKAFGGSHTYEQAAGVIKSRLDAGLPVPYLMLHHKDTKFKDFIWHWFLLVGYDEKEKDLNVMTANYGELTTISLKELWDTGYEETGGLVIYT